MSDKLLGQGDLCPCNRFQQIPDQPWFKYDKRQTEINSSKNCRQKNSLYHLKKGSEEYLDG